MKNKTSFYLILILITATGFFLIPRYIFHGNMYSKEDTLNTSTYWNLAPLVIDDSGGGDYTWAEAVLEDWCAGSGTENAPYIIENVAINGGNSTSCIEIKQSSVYFIIRNCTLTNSAKNDAGIYLYNVENGKLVDNNCSLNYGFGILAAMVSSISISNNHIHNNILGMYLYKCNQSSITENLITENQNKGIYLKDNCNYNEILYNTVNDNQDSGIYLSFSYHTDIMHNTANNNKWDGIHLFGSDHNTISENIIEYNKHYGISLLRSDNNLITENEIIYVLSCIEQDEECQDNTINNNSCTGSIIDDDFLDEDFPSLIIILIIALSFGAVVIIAVIVYWLRKRK